MWIVSTKHNKENYWNFLERPHETKNDTWYVTTTRAWAFRFETRKEAMEAIIDWDKFHEIRVEYEE